MDEIVVGDLVKLKSGGPWMTVTEINFQKVTALWFSEVACTPLAFTFPLECLQKALNPKDRTEVNNSGFSRTYISTGHPSSGFTGQS
jgi:uncharacterized protein YodC (DUF2158 family)